MCRHNPAEACGILGAEANSKSQGPGDRKAFQSGHSRGYNPRIIAHSTLVMHAAGLTGGVWQDEEKKISAGDR